MIHNYIKIAFRNLLRHKMIASINLLGLTVGLSCCLLILVYVLNENSYDRTNPASDRIYRITRSFHNDDGSENLHLSAIAPAFGPLLKTDFPEFENMTRLTSNGGTVVKYGEKILNERNVYFADENFFEFFNVPIIKGATGKSLSDPGSLLMSEEMAEKYFGTDNPVDKIVKIDNQRLYKVAGIFSSFPSNSHLHPKILLSFNSLKDSTVYGERRLNRSFSNNAFYTYIKLPSGLPSKKIEDRFPAFIDKHMGPLVPATVKMSKYTKLYLQKLTDIHLHSHLDDEIEANGDIKRVYTFTCIALFILLIACINYMNLSTARSVIRSKEIGIRKAIGAQRREIIFQFLNESVIITFISLCLAVLLSLAVLPLINPVSGQQLSMSSLLNLKTILMLLLVPLAVGIMSGLYPALFMSGFNTISVLKGIFRMDVKGLSFRKVLVVSQFAISIILIVATIVVNRQLDFMQNTSLGYEKDKVIALNYPPSLDDKYDSFRIELLSDPSIQSIARSSRIPTGRLLDDLGSVSVPSGDTMKVVKNADVKFISVDHEFIPTYGIKIAAGRNFSKSFSSDSNNYLLNASAARILGWKNPEEAVGKTIRYGGVTGLLVGITNDFHFESMREPIIPLLLSMSPNYNSVSVKITNVKAALSKLEETWEKYLAEVPFQFTFMEENVARLYESEQQQSRLFSIFSFISIFIACLGLFGLSAFTISQRVKEIGIRKVLGANVPEIVKVLSADFLKLVLIAVLIGLPFSWWAMHKWLEDFAYRISIPWWALFLASAAAILIAFVTVSSQAIKAAITNPVKSLRTE